MTPTIRETVAERVARLRHKAGLTQPELAELAGCNVVTVNRVERGKQSLYIEGLCALADALGVTPDALLGYADMPERPDPKPQTRQPQALAPVG